MKACLQLQQLFCSRENQLPSRFIQQNEKSTSYLQIFSGYILCHMNMSREICSLTVLVPIIQKCTLACMKWIRAQNRDFQLCDLCMSLVLVYTSDEYMYWDWSPADRHHPTYLTDYNGNSSQVGNKTLPWTLISGILEVTPSAVCTKTYIFLNIRSHFSCNRLHKLRVTWKYVKI